MAEKLEAVVIGSGFGGAITSCRLGKKWPGKVMIFERGKRYPMGSFPRSPRGMARNFWNMPDEGIPRPPSMHAHTERGMFDIRNYKHMNAVLAAGWGGGSLIYANVFLEPPEHIFDDRWPAAVRKKDLDPYYSIVKKVLGSRPIPDWKNEPRRRIIRTELFQKFAKEAGRDSKLVDLNVFFGNDFNKPTEIGIQEENRYGATQTSCTYCAECDVGCNTHSKNTLDLNYLHVAEHRYKVQVRTETKVVKIVPLNESGADDPTQDGTHGYRIYYRDLTRDGAADQTIDTQRVVVSAGTLGTGELIFRCRDHYKTLPKINNRLGQRFSGNGDFLSFVVNNKEPADPNYGPVITQRIDYNLFKDFDKDRAFIMEDASYPAFAAWFAEGIKPGFLRFKAMWYSFVDALERIFMGRKTGRVGWLLEDMMTGDISYRTTVHLCMGIDKSDGVLSLSKNNTIDLDWKYKNSMPLYKAILASVKDFYKRMKGKFWFPLPTWNLPFRKDVTVHALGGCVLGDTPEQGVTSAKREEFGQFFGYKGLYAADGSIVPTAVGANPTATISALSELVAEGITGIKPDDEL